MCACLFCSSITRHEVRGCNHSADPYGVEHPSRQPPNHVQWGRMSRKRVQGHDRTYCQHRGVATQRLPVQAIRAFPSLPHRYTLIPIPTSKHSSNYTTFYMFTFHKMYYVITIRLRAISKTKLMVLNIYL